MNFALLLKYFGLVSTVLVAIEALTSDISSGAPAVTPALSTYLEGKHVNVTVHIDPASP